MWICQTYFGAATKTHSAGYFHLLLVDIDNVWYLLGELFQWLAFTLNVFHSKNMSQFRSGRSGTN